MTTTLKRAASMALGFGLAGSLAEAEGVYNGYEAAPYRVERAVGGAEIRLYQPHIVAEVTVRGAQSQALSRGFSELARYIFGGNTSADKVAMTTPVTQRPAEKIAMTTPVTQRPAEKIAMTTPVAQTGAGDLWTVNFTMPAAYDLTTLPVPNSDTIRFVEVPAHRQIVLQFSGRGTTARMQDKDAALQVIAAEAGITVKSGPHYYFYDDPMTLPWNRRNEVAYDID